MTDLEADLEQARDAWQKELGRLCAAAPEDLPYVTAPPLTIDDIAAYILALQRKV